MCLCGKGNGYDVSHSGYYLICDKQCYKSRTHVAKVFSGTVVREGKLIQKTRQLLKTVPFNHEQMAGPFRRFARNICKICKTTWPKQHCVVEEHSVCYE